MGIGEHTLIRMRINSYVYLKNLIKRTYVAMWLNLFSAHYLGPSW